MSNLTNGSTFTDVFVQTSAPLLLWRSVKTETNFIVDKTAGYFWFPRVVPTCQHSPTSCVTQVLPGRWVKWPRSCELVNMSAVSSVSPTVNCKCYFTRLWIFKEDVLAKLSWWVTAFLRSSQESAIASQLASWVRTLVFTQQRYFSYDSATWHVSSGLICALT